MVLQEAEDGVEDRTDHTEEAHGDQEEDHGSIQEAALTEPEEVAILARERMTIT